MAKPKPTTRIHEPRWSDEDYRRRPGPDDYDPDVGRMIVRMIANGETLGAVCGNNRDYPLPGDFLVWCQREPELDALYRAARAIQAEVLLDGIVEDSRTGVWDSSIRVQAGRIHVEKTYPARFGPRAVVPITPSKEQNGDDREPDYTAELRRKIEAMASRAAAEAPGAGPQAKRPPDDAARGRRS